MKFSCSGVSIALRPLVLGPIVDATEVHRPPSVATLIVVLCLYQSNYFTHRERESTHTCQALISGEESSVGEETQVSVVEEEADEEMVDDGGYQDENLNLAFTRLGTKVKSMVDNIEVQLTDVEAKIGDRLHFLDKDGDGILSREEVAMCLQEVLKRDLSIEQALAIASDMDENKDGLFSVDELNEWLETNKLVKLVEEGDHAEADNLISERLNAEEAANVEKFNADMLASTNAEKLLTEEAANAKKLDVEQQIVETGEKTQGNNRPN